MEQIFSVTGKFWLIIAISIIVCANCLEKSKDQKKLDALENLFRGEMYLIKEKLEEGRQERKLILEKLNETNGRTLTGNNSETRHNDLDKLKFELEILSDKVTQNDFDTGEVLQALARMKRAVEEEKVARKSDGNAVTELLLTMQNSLSEMKNSQNEFKSTQNEMKSTQNEMKKAVEEQKVERKSDSNAVTELLLTMQDSLSEINSTQNEMKSSQNEMKSTQKEMKNSQNEIKSTQNEMKSTQDEMKRTQNEMKSTQNEMKSTQNETKSTQNVMKINQQKIEQNVKSLVSKQDAISDMLGQQFEALTKKVRALVLISNLQFSVKLVGGSNKYEGRVEFDYNGRPGTVCDDDWDNNNARVVCRMLEYSGGTALKGPGVTNGHRFGEGTGDILLDNVDCTGTEDSLFECTHAGIGVHNCDHSEDAGVRCDP